MKKITLLAFFSLFLVLGCTKEIPVITVFDFELDALYVSNTVVNTPRTTEFTITPEREVTTTKYEFRYALTQGSGHFLDEAGEIIPENQWRALDGLIFNFDYFPTTAETHQVIVYVRDSAGNYEHSQELTYLVSNNGFNFTAVATSIDVNVNIPIQVNFNLNQIGEGSVVYSMIFESTGTGTFEYEGITYSAGETIPITQGASNGNYAGTTGGIHNVTFTVNNDNTPPVFMEDSINILINNYLFDFNGFPNQNTIFSGGTITLNFDVDEIEGQSPLYEMRYVFDAGNAIIRNEDGQEISPDTYYEVLDPLNSFTWEFEGSDIGPIIISFYMRNHIESEESITFNIQVEQPSDFSINTFVHQNNVYQTGGAGELCAIYYYSRATFTADYVAEGGDLTFVSLVRTDTGATVDNVAHFLSQGESMTYNNLVDNIEYEVHYTNMATGENIIKTFISETAPPNQNLQNCFPGG